MSTAADIVSGIVPGYDYRGVYTLRASRQRVDLSAATSVLAKVRVRGTGQILAQVACLSSTTGAEWASGQVVVEIPAATTSTLAAMDDPVEIEFAVTIASKTTPYRVLTKIHKGDL